MDVSRHLKHNIVVTNKGRSRECFDNKNLMDSLSVSSDLVPKGCHNGACGLCKIKVLKGEFEKTKMNRKHISEEEENNNILLACRVFPRSAMEIELIAKQKPITYVFGA